MCVMTSQCHRMCAMTSHMTSQFHSDITFCELKLNIRSCSSVQLHFSKTKNTERMEAILRSKESEILALQTTIGLMERHRREDEDWWQAQLDEKDHQVFLLRKALSDMAEQKESFDIQKEEWRREKESMKENLEKTVEWATTFIQEKSKEIAFLLETVQQLRDETAKVSEDRDEMERDLKVKDSRIEQLCQTIETLNIEKEMELSSTIAGLEALSKGKELMEALMEETEARVMVECQDTMNRLNSLMVTLDLYKENQKQGAVKQREGETQTQVSLPKKRRGFKRLFWRKNNNGLKEPKA